MAGRLVTLRRFNADELIFNEDETRAILEFFFPALQVRIAAVTADSAIRSFAQGLLVEAIDATYALGYIEILVTTFRFPGPGLKQVLQKVGTKAAVHWFKHASGRRLHNAKIAETVRRQLSHSFATVMQAMLSGLALAPTPERLAVAFVHYAEPSRPTKVWC